MKSEQLSIFSGAESRKKLTISEAATQLSVSEATVRNWIHEGEFIELRTIIIIEI